MARIAPASPTFSVPLLLAVGAMVSSAWLTGCKEDGPALSKVDAEDTKGATFETPDLGEVKSDGPRIGAVIDHAPIFAAAHGDSPVLGYLHAGETLPRSTEAHENDQCTEGWYRVAPRGYM